MEQLKHSKSMRLESRAGKASRIYIPKNIFPSSPRRASIASDIPPPVITYEIALKEYQKVKAEIEAAKNSDRASGSSSFLSIERQYNYNPETPSPDKYSPSYKFIKPSIPTLAIINTNKNKAREKRGLLPKCIHAETSLCSYPSKYIIPKLDRDTSFQPQTFHSTKKFLSRSPTKRKEESPEYGVVDQNIKIPSDQDTSINRSIKGPDFSKSPGRKDDYLHVNSSFRFYNKNSDSFRSYTPDFSRQTSREALLNKKFSRDTLNYDKYLEACNKTKPRSNVSVPSIDKLSPRDDRFIFNRGYFGVSRGRYYK
jgi:hypothetical protein